MNNVNYLSLLKIISLTYLTLFNFFYSHAVIHRLQEEYYYFCHMLTFFKKKTLNKWRENKVRKGQEMSKKHKAEMNGHCIVNKWSFYFHVT
jgi:hypothetical protein